MGQQGENERIGQDGMNLVVIEEHQVRDLVFAQTYYLYRSEERPCRERVCAIV